MDKYIFGLLLFLSGIISSCHTLKTNTFSNYGSGILGGYQTYGWVEETKAQSGVEGELVDSTRYDRWIREVVDQDLAERGLELVHPDDAQLLLAYYFFMKEDIEEVHNSAPYANEWYQKGIYIQGANVVSKMRGVLYINIVDVRKEESIWLGWGERKLKAKHLGKSGIQSAIQKIMEQL